MPSRLLRMNQVHWPSSGRGRHRIRGLDPWRQAGEGRLRLVGVQHPGFAGGLAAQGSSNWRSELER
jgi:ribosomal protein L4